MSKKTAALTGGLLAKKGTGEAAPVAGVPQRGATPAKPTREPLAPLNFRMPESFVQEFKAYADASGRKGTAVLRMAFEALKEKERKST